MAIKKCKECGAKVSTRAATCPSCGAPVKAKGCFSGCSFIVVLLVIASGVAILNSKPTVPLTPADQADAAPQLADRKADAAKQEQKDDGFLATLNRARDAARKKSAAADPPADAVRQLAERKAAAAKQEEKHDAFIATLKATGSPTSISMLKAGQVEGDTITISVADTWHLMPYQLRLQAAQNLWQVWADIASPREPDHARLKLVDMNGNEVGGSRLIGGSLIWVQEK